MNKIRIRCPAVFLSALILLLWQDHTGGVRFALLSAVLHESGHILAAWWITGRFPALTISLTGISLRTSRFLSAGELFLLAAAGPMSNFMACIALMMKLDHQASYWGYFLACSNLCMGLFNLIPLGPLDGKRMLQALRMTQLTK